MFKIADDFNNWALQAPSANQTILQDARALQQRLTKPPGALGRLEDVACWLASWQERLRPHADKVEVYVFAGNHGVTDRGVSPYPAAVTEQMVLNFQAGGAAINAISSEFGYALYVTPVDLENPTADFSRGPAMSEAECLDALNIGTAAVNEDAELIVFGEMGIGNTTTASALAAAVLGGSGSDWAGRGTGHDDKGVRLKAKVIDEALALHQSHLNTPFEILRRLGGREIAAMAGGIIAARQKRIPVILDGFVVSAAAAVAAMSGSHALDHCLAGHVSAEQAHQVLLEKLALQPLFDLGMRLGEGTGAALAVQIVRAASATHGRMATFGEAGVSDRDFMIRGLQDRADELKAALILLTRLPLPELDPFPPQGRAVWAYPIAGAAVGLVGGFTMLNAGLVMPNYMAAILGMSVCLLLTGALHEDGLADFWDGIGGGRNPADKLRIMRDSHLGSYGAMALILGFASRLAGLIAIGPLAPLAFICAHAMARGALALPMRLFPPARTDGITAEAGKPGPASFAIAIALPIVLSTLILPPVPALIACGCACAAVLAVGVLARKQLGGVTGDVLGSAEQAAEITFLWGIAVFVTF